MRGALVVLVSAGSVLGCGRDAPVRDAPPRADAPRAADARDPIDAPAPRCPPVAGNRVTLRQIATTDDAPLLVTSPPGDDRLFVVERLGTIRELRDGVAVDPPFLDLRESTGGPVSAGIEKGLLGLAFHPDYATNRRFFVFYTSAVVYRLNVLAEFTTDATDPTHADRATKRELLLIRDYASNHNAGMIAFDASGLLVIGTGDGGGGGDPNENGQDPDELLGKFLRIDVDQTTPTTPYGIPPGNPYVVGGGRPEVLAIGVRNPWRWSFDRATGDIYIGDVGQNEHEEIDVLSPQDLVGANLGWNDREGAACYDPLTGCVTAGRTDPVLDLPHGPADHNCAVIGGEVYRGSCFPDLVGRYFFTDYCRSELRSFRYEAGAVVDLQTHADAVFTSPTSLHGDAFGELHLTTEGGRIYAIEVTP